MPYPAVPLEPLVEPEHWRTLPTKLVRPDMPDVKMENVLCAQPAFEGLTPKLVRSGWSHVAYKPMGIFRRVHIDSPKAALPKAENILLNFEGLAGCTTHAFAVYTYAPPGTFDPTARQRKVARFRRCVDIYPTHAAIWAAYCSRLPPMPSQPTKIKVYSDPRRRAAVVRLPVVPIAVPYPPMFYFLQWFVYTYRKSTFINALLPCRKFQLPPDRLEDPPREVTVPLYARALADSYDLRRLCQMARNVHGMYRNMVALGVVETRMWDALEYTWDTLLSAMELVEQKKTEEAQAA
ncbi:hypothetical protein C8Q77DRAFT_1056489 [Trametes polyzona]|nr:hypothetical protein C8Q77DRAFT_1056489 [Trametes polyzona]